MGPKIQVRILPVSAVTAAFSTEFESAGINQSRHKIYLSLDATVRLASGDPEAIRQTMRDLMERRKTSQPLEYPSAGSFFKRPEGYFAGALIEQSNLKGVSVGGAQVSEKHAGFLINKGGATAADFLGLKELVQKTVMEKFGVMLEAEVRILGSDL